MSKYTRKEIEKKISNLSAAYKTGWVYDREKKEPGSAIANCMIDLFMDSAKRQEYVNERYETILYNFINVPDTNEADSLCYFSIKPDTDLGCITLKENTRLINSVEEGAAFLLDKEYNIAPLNIEKIVYINKREQIVSTMYSSKSYDNLQTSYYGETDNIIALKDISKNNQIKFVTELTFINAFDNIKQPKFLLRFYNKNGEVSEECMKLFFDSDVEWSIIYNEIELPASIIYDKGVPLLYIKDADFMIDEEIIFDEHVYILRAVLKNAEKIKEQSFCSAAISLYLDYSEPDIVMLEDEVQNNNEGFYLFGKRLEEAGTCYISSNSIFGKKEFDISMKFTVDFEVIEDELPEYEKKPFKLIMTSMPVRYGFKHADCKVRRIKAEYFNGSRWTEIDNNAQINESVNIEEFIVLGRIIEKEQNISFTAPKDWTPCVYDGEAKYWLRIRAIEVENENEPYKKSFVPIIKNMYFSCSCTGRTLNAVKVVVSNGIKKIEKERNESIPAFLKYNEENKEPVILIGFDNRPPRESGICMLVNNLKETNYVFLNITKMKNKMLLDTQAWWFPISLKSLGEGAEKIEKIYLNVVSGILEKTTEKEIGAQYKFDEDLDIKCDIESISNMLPVKSTIGELEKRKHIRQYIKSFNKIVTRKDLEEFLMEKYPDIEKLYIYDSVSLLKLQMKIKEQPQKKLLMPILEKSIRNDIKKELPYDKTIIVEWSVS